MFTGRCVALGFLFGLSSFEIADQNATRFRSNDSYYVKKNNKKKIGVRDIVMAMLLNFTSQAPVVIALHTVFCTFVPVDDNNSNNHSDPFFWLSRDIGVTFFARAKPCEQGKT